MEKATRSDMEMRFENSAAAQIVQYVYPKLGLKAIWNSTIKSPFSSRKFWSVRTGLSIYRR